MTTLREAAQQALEAMRCGVPTGKITLADWSKALSDLDAALAQKQVEPVKKPLTISKLRAALVGARLVDPDAVERPDEYDDGVTLYRIEALHRRLT